MTEPGTREITLSDGRVVAIDIDDPHSDDQIREALEGHRCHS